ncbi:MAG: response regulator transcription factor [Acidobacteriales bacterium]|nr:response regulator transcription factor [Terriglobales bacterium]
MLKLILADNQAIFRAGAAKVLAVEDDFRIVGQATNFEQAVMALEKFRAGILIFSAALHGKMSEVVEMANKYNTTVVAVAENGENTSRYLTAGAKGVVFRNVTGPALVECIRKISKGQTWVQSEDSSTGTDGSDVVGARVRDRLTPKELRIVALIVQGYKNKEIANQLGTTEQVIKNYLRNVYDKIGVSDRLELALFTIHHRMLAEAAAATAANANASAATTSS